MKKITLLSFVLVAMIFLGMNVNSSVRINTVNNNSTAYIHYQVNVHPDWAIIHNSCPLMVSLTDGSNMVIGLPKLYHPNISTYDFYEMGPVTGVRKARLANSDEYQPDNVCTIITSSDAKSGTFYNGWNYIYDLYGSTKAIIKADDSKVTQ